MNETSWNESHVALSEFEGVVCWTVAVVTNCVSHSCNKWHIQFGKPADKIHKRIDYEIRYKAVRYDTIRYGQQHLFDFSCNKPEKMPISTLFPFIFMKKIHPKLSIQQRKKLKLYIRSAVCCVHCALTEEENIVNAKNRHRIYECI